MMITPTPMCWCVLCELVWVLRRVYAFTRNDCVGAIEALMG